MTHQWFGSAVLVTGGARGLGDRGWLDAPVARVGAPDVPMPFNDRLERAVIPSAERILAALKALFADA